MGASSDHRTTQEVRRRTLAVAGSQEPGSIDAHGDGIRPGPALGVVSEGDSTFPSRGPAQPLAVEVEQKSGGARH